MDAGEPGDELKAFEALVRADERSAERGEPDWKAEYQKSVELHCITLDELREARVELKAILKEKNSD